MLYRNTLFLALGLVSTGILTCPSVAAPTVKRLVATNTGTGNVQGGNNTTTTTTPRAPTTTQRASSLRTSGSYLKPRTGTTGGTAVSTTNTSAIGNASSARLSGFHGNIVKGIGSKISQNQPNTSSGSDTIPSDLTDRVITLEEQIATKQPTLEPGDGIEIDGNTISVSQEMASLPTRVSDLEQQVGDLSLTNYWTITQIQEYLGQNYYTGQQIDDIISQLPTSKIANNFDPNILRNGQSGGAQGQP